MNISPFMSVETKKIFCSLMFFSLWNYKSQQQSDESNRTNINKKNCIDNIF